MDLGIHYATFTTPAWETTLVDRLTATAKIADEGGISLFTLMDHYFQMVDFGGPFEPMLEGYTTLGYLAAVTERVRLGLLVTGTTYRHPGLLAKTVSTLDVLTGGRAVLGLGAAWYEREHLGLGVPFPPLAERFERLEETLQVCRQMWSDENGAFKGRHYRLAETICAPRPLQSPRVPILIGGSGERKTLRLVAQYADACNLFGDDPEVIRHKLDVLRRHCDGVGRDYAEIEKTVVAAGDPVGERDDFLREMAAYAELGISLVATSPRGDDPVAWTTAVCEDLLPRLAELA